VVGVFLLVFIGSPLPPDALLALLLTWLASLSANLYVVGINQVTDVDIDRVNKPALPLASGDFSQRTGLALSLAAGVVALLLGWQQGPALLLTVLLVMLLGSLYSLPPLRLKNHPLLAGLSIALARGFFANLGVWLHFRGLLPGAPAMPLPLGWALLFFFLFGWVIAVYKDIPDWHGDRLFAVRTFAVQFGQAQVFRLGRVLVTLMYLVPIGLGVWLLPDQAGWMLLLGHAAALAAFWAISARTDPTDPASMMRTYLFLWLLFYGEYALLVLARLVA
jgi:homogentisate phytyltransferase/homogentisate geranylgeranyltransferase